MIHQYPMIQRLIPIVHIFQNDIFANHTVLRTDFVENALFLEVHVETAGWEEAAEAEAVAFA
jgi:hypothetical protein